MQSIKCTKSLSMKLLNQCTKAISNKFPLSFIKCQYTPHNKLNPITNICLKNENLFFYLQVSFAAEI